MKTFNEGTCFYVSILCLPDQMNPYMGLYPKDVYKLLFAIFPKIINLA